MKKITKETPRVQFTVQELVLDVPVPFSLGDKLETEGEVSAMNQTYAENIRNNCAKPIKTIREAEKDSAKATAAAQKLVSEYVEKYEFGVRTGGGLKADPIRSTALGLAKTLVRKIWKKEGKKTTDYTAAELSAAANKVVDANPQLMEYAKKEVTAKRNAVKDIKI
jgi:hypothetical protein